MHQIHNITLRNLHPLPCFFGFFSRWMYTGPGGAAMLRLASASASIFTLVRLQPSQRCWELLIPCRICSLSGLLCTHRAGRPGCLVGGCAGPGAAPPLADLHAHKTADQPRGHNCQLLPASEHSTHERTHTRTHALSSSLPVFLLPSVQCTQVQSMLGELMVQVEGVGTAEEGRWGIVGRVRLKGQDFLWETRRHKDSFGLVSRLFSSFSSLLPNKPVMAPSVKNLHSADCC